MDFERCIICQGPESADLRCPALDKNTPNAPEVYGFFIADWEKIRKAGISIKNEHIPSSEATVQNLLAKRAKWHRNCRREFRSDRVERKLNADKKKNITDPSTESTTETARRSERKRGVPKFPNTCLFCKRPEEKKNVLHSFQKIELTEDILNKATILNDDHIIAQLSSGDVVANELKYHTKCFVLFNRRVEASSSKTDNTEESSKSTKVIEEILGMVEEDLAEGRTCFSMKSLSEEMNSRSEFYNVPPMNRTRLKSAILDRFSPVLKEMTGFRNEVVLVCSTAMKDVVQSSLVSTTPSEDSVFFRKQLCYADGKC
jgi:hypothetical protein